MAKRKKGKQETIVDSSIEINQDEDDYEDTMARILADEAHIQHMQENIFLLQQERHVLERKHGICKVPEKYIEQPFDTCNYSYSSPNSEHHHDFALFMASRLGDDVAVTHALQEGKELNFRHYQVTMAETPCKYKIDWVPFQPTGQTALHVAYHNLEIIGLLISYGFSCEAVDAKGLLPEDIALSRRYKEEYKRLMYKRKNVQRKRALDKIEKEKMMKKIKGQ
eukprot:g5938.t1